jgi:hypothetical protein
MTDPGFLAFQDIREIVSVAFCKGMLDGLRYIFVILVLFDQNAYGKLLDPGKCGRDSSTRHGLIHGRFRPKKDMRRAVTAIHSPLSRHHLDRACVAAPVVESENGYFLLWL